MKWWRKICPTATMSISTEMNSGLSSAKTMTNARVTAWPHKIIALKINGPKYLWHFFNKKIFKMPMQRPNTKEMILLKKIFNFQTKQSIQLIFCYQMISGKFGLQKNIKYWNCKLKTHSCMDLCMSMYAVSSCRMSLSALEHVKG